LRHLFLIFRKYLLSGIESPHPVLFGAEAALGQFVGNEPVPIARIVGMDVERGVDQIGVFPVALRDRG
jgi:hypothetical protein